MLYDPDKKTHLSDKPYDTLGFDITTAFVDANSTYANEKLEIGFDIMMKRIIRPFVYQYYLPCIAIVFISQVSFIVPLSAIPGRIALVVTQFLALTNIYVQQMVLKINLYT